MERRTSDSRSEVPEPDRSCDCLAKYARTSEEKARDAIVLCKAGLRFAVEALVGSSTGAYWA